MDAKRAVKATLIVGGGLTGCAAGTCGFFWLIAVYPSLLPWILMGVMLAMLITLVAFGWFIIYEDLEMWGE
jgi:hypothetical protein